jgi:hypothetical protein
VNFSDLKPLRKSAPNNPFIMEVPVISTVHLPEAECRLLDQLSEADAGVLFSGHEYGGVLFRIDDDEDSSYTNAPTLNDLLQRLGAVGFEYARFDSVGDTFTDLPTFQ